MLVQLQRRPRFLESQILDRQQVKRLQFVRLQLSLNLKGFIVNLAIKPAAITTIIVRQ